MRQDLMCGAMMMAAVGGLAAERTAAVQRLALVRDGRPAASIVIASNATRAAQFAAEELREHVKAISGAALPIVKDEADGSGLRILVGESRATEALGLPGRPFEPQEYLVQFLPDTIVLMGKDADDRSPITYEADDSGANRNLPDFFEEQGTCHAVYDFLEQFCGVRWFRPGALGRVCPRAETLEVAGWDSRRSPEFKHRNPYPLLVMPGDYDRWTGLWSWGKRGRDDEKLAEVEALAYPELEGKSAQAKAGLIRLFLHRMRLGGEPCQYSHAFYGYYDRFWKRNPKTPDAFDGDHPDWFAQGYSEKPSPIRKEGERPARTYFETPPQMCYSNPEFIRQVVRDARDFFDGRGKDGLVAAGDAFSLAPMDNGRWCRCPACRALIKEEADRGREEFSNDRASEYIFSFANKVAREVGKTHPDKQLTILAYASYAYPPERERLEPNLTVVFVHGIRPANPVNREILRAWRETAPDNRLLVWLWYLNPMYDARLGNYHCFPGFFAHGVGDAFKAYSQHDVRGAFLEGLGQDVEVYVTCKLMDDPGRDMAALLDDYFTGLYGAAAEPMKAFYRKVERIYSDPSNTPTGVNQQAVAWDYQGTAERMAELGALMDQAHAAAGTGIEAARVNLFDKQIWEYMTVGRRRYLDRLQAEIPSVKAPKAPEAGGDPAAVDWARAAVLGRWFKMEGGAAERKVEGRLVHDGRWLYLQLTEQADPDSLRIDPATIWMDDWEIYVARQREKPYRQLGLGPTGRAESLAWGEEEGKRNSPWDSGVKAVSDLSGSEAWSVRAALPLEKLLPGGVKPGDTFYLNIVRARHVDNQWHQITWSPFSAVHQVDRLGEVVLE